VSEFLQDYAFVLKHKARVENKIVDALSRRVMILEGMSAEVTGFESLIEDYESCPNFGEIYDMLRDSSVREVDEFLLQDGYLFRFRKVCILCMSLRDFLSWEMHTGGLAGHFDQNKMI